MAAGVAAMVPCAPSAKEEYPEATIELKVDAGLWPFACLRQCRFLNNSVGQDHRRIRRPIRPGRGFGSFWTARRALAGFEATATIRKGQAEGIGRHDMKAQAGFVAGLSDIAA